MSNPLITNYDTSQIFLGRQRTDTASYTNGTGDDVTLAAGTLIGRILTGESAGKIAVQDSDATDGSQDPIGILYENYEVADGATETLTYAVGGDVDAGLLTYASGDDEDTVIYAVGTDAASPPVGVTIPLGTIKDRLQMRGFVLKATTELTAIDNPQS